MTDTTITFRTDEQVKKDAVKLYESLGMSLSTALNIFMRQSIAKQKYPCSIEAEIARNYRYTYPEGFFDLFGADTDTDTQMIAQREMPLKKDAKRMPL